MTHENNVLVSSDANCSGTALVLLNASHISIPVSIFFNNACGSLEIISKYLKDCLHLKFHEIASLLNRDDRTIWGSYQAAKHHPCKSDLTALTIPLSIFRNRAFSVLEQIVGYLKDHHQLKFSQIARLIARDDRTVWTTYHRLKKKEKTLNGQPK